MFDYRFFFFWKLKNMLLRETRPDIRLCSVSLCCHSCEFRFHRFESCVQTPNIFCVILSSADSCRNIHIYAGYILTQWTTDARNDKDAGRLLYKIYLPLTLFVRVRKGCVGFYCERELGTEHNWNILTPKLWPSALCLSRYPGLLNRRPRAHSAGWWLSLLHLISIFSGPQLIRASWSLPPDVAFPTTSRLQLASTPLARRTQLSYIIVRRPLDLWNRMFNRHQAEMTVMQFRGHSLPVHQSKSVPWEFF